MTVDAPAAVSELQAEPTRLAGRRHLETSAAKLDSTSELHWNHTSYHIISTDCVSHSNATFLQVL